MYTKSEANMPGWKAQKVGALSVDSLSYL